MKDKPEKIWLIQMDDRNLVWCDSPDPTNGDTIPDEDRTEYLRADLAKPSEWISVEKLKGLLSQCVEHINFTIDGGCDHSVGICVCEDIALKEEIINTIKKPSPPTRETP